MSIHVKVPGKLILIGEYAVLEGADALVATVNRYVNVEISAPENEICEISSNLTTRPLRFIIHKDGSCDIEQGQSEDLISTFKFSLSIISKICSHIIGLGFPLHPFSIKIDTSQFYFDEYKLGIGSSAAMTIALIISIVNHLGIDNKLFSNKYDIFRFARETHFFAQGNRGSGIDIAASLFGGINVYNLNNLNPGKSSQQISGISVLSGLFMLPVWTGVSMSTRKLLAQVEAFQSNHEEEYKEIMSRLSTLSSSGCLTYAENKISDFLDIIQDYYQVLLNFSARSKIPIISEIHEKIAEIVNVSGGIYKPSGAGGGDIGIAFSDSKRILEKVKLELAKNNIDTLSLEISETGFEVEL